MIRVRTAPVSHYGGRIRKLSSGPGPDIEVPVQSEPIIVGYEMFYSSQIVSLLFTPLGGAKEGVDRVQQSGGRSPAPH